MLNVYSHWAYEASAISILQPQMPHATMSALSFGESALTAQVEEKAPQVKYGTMAPMVTLYVSF
jgi:hypothetical protein